MLTMDFLTMMTASDEDDEKIIFYKPKKHT